MLVGWLVVWKLAGIEERKLGFPQVYAKVHNGNKKNIQPGCVIVLN